MTDVLTDYVVDFMRRFAASRSWCSWRTRRCIPTCSSAMTERAAVAGPGRGIRSGRASSRALCAVGRAAPAECVGRRCSANRRCSAPIPGLPPLSPATGTPDQDVRDRLEMLLGVDESLAASTALRELGELENTVIILTSDHGYFYGEHGLNEERRLAYEETARIPLIVRYPRVATAGATRRRWRRRSIWRRRFSRWPA